MNRVLVVLLVGLFIALSGCVSDEVFDDAPVEDADPDGDDLSGEVDDGESTVDDSTSEATQEDRPPPGDGDEADLADGDSGDQASEDDDGQDNDGGADDGTDESGDDDTGTDDASGGDGTAGGDSGDDTDDGTGGDDSTEPGALEIHHLDVGQGDATVILTPTEETIVVDTGDWPDDGQQVIDYLTARGVERIDHLVATHAHADHIGGHAAVIEYFETHANGIGAAYDSGIAHTTLTYDNYLDAVETHDVDLYTVVEGDELPLSDPDVTVRVVNPPESTTSDDFHYNSVSLLVEFGEIRYLTTGDAERDAESRMVSRWGDDLDVDIYQAGHHGSSTSSTGSFLDVVSPEYAVISSAFDSQYGHPHDEVLERFDELGVETYWTGAHGTVVFTTDGHAVSVETDRENATQPLDLLALKHGEETGDDGDDGDDGDNGDDSEDGDDGEHDWDDGDDSDGDAHDGTSDGPLSGVLDVSALNVDAPVDEEYVVLRNVGEDALDLGGWQVRDREGDGRVAGGYSPFQFPAEFELDAGESVTIWTKDGVATQSDLYWGYNVNMWRADGDVVILTTPSGEHRFEYAYGDQQ